MVAAAAGTTWKAVATHVPPAAAHLATVGQPVSESVAVVHGIRYRMAEFEIDRPLKRRVPVERPVRQMHHNGEMIEEPLLYPTHQARDFDAIEARRRYLETPPTVTVTTEGTISATVECDGYTAVVMLKAPAGVGAEGGNADARKRLEDAVGAVWRAHVRGGV